MSRNKTAKTISLILVLTFTASILAMPTVSAQSTRKTYALCGLTPNPVGVNQETLVWVGISHPTTWPQPGWTGLTVTVTKPDGSKQTLGPFDTDTTGSTGTIYIPSVVGNYTFQTHFPEQTLLYSAQGTPANTTMLASSSPIVTLTVQENPIDYYPPSPLPTEYWTRPINTQHREWSTISGNWLGSVPNLYAPYTEAPGTAHVMWAKELTTGGLTGGEYGTHGFFTGDAYEGLMMSRASPIIINGILYYNQFPTTYNVQIARAIDLRTGKDVWSRNDTRVDIGQVLQYDNQNQMGNIAYVWRVVGSTWHAYNPLTGDWMYTMTGVPASFFFGGFGATTVRGPNGEILAYSINTARGWMAMWNSTAIPALYGSSDPSNVYNWYTWRPWGKTVSATAACPVTPETPMGISGYSWNVTIPTGLTGSAQVVLSDRIIGASIGSDSVRTWGISLKTGQRGQLLFDKTWNAPPGNLSIVWVGADEQSGVYILRARETTAYYGFSIDTGQELWGPTEPEGQLNIWVGTVPRIAYGKLFSSGYDGILYAYDAKTGDRLWTYEAKDFYSEIKWSNNWPIHIGAIADGKIIIYHMEHSANEPKARGAPLSVIDVETGEEVWRIPFRETYWGSDPAIADGQLVLLNTYDNRIYSFGKGPSATTVEASPKVLVHGTSVLIEGTVTDISAGTEQNEQAARFPYGIPAVSDESMTEWMKYVYMQFPRPTDVTGVEVTLSVLDENGNCREIGTVTSDADGFYSFMWTPDIPGKYTVYASFAGSESYWSSNAETAFGVDEAPPAPSEPEPAPPSMTETYVLAGIAATIATIVVVGVVLALLMRKKA
ncbi:TPA: PQQ-binding-like beta-propeller repeat protein [Candidatus Bathyarchaeota archaeon]|nr:PQQ-binding-like beta-propeller repeat protein [Candidatus Bathyarchaeota archaeon]